MQNVTVIAWKAAKNRVPVNATRTVAARVEYGTDPVKPVFDQVSVCCQLGTDAVKTLSGQVSVCCQLECGTDTLKPVSG